MFGPLFQELDSFKDFASKVMNTSTCASVSDDAKHLRELVKLCQVQYTESAFAFAVNNLFNKHGKELDMKNILSTHHGYLLSRTNGATEAMIHPILMTAAKKFM